MNNTKFNYDTQLARVITEINCYPVNMVYDTGGRILNLPTESSSMPVISENNVIDADLPTIVEKKD